IARESDSQQLRQTLPWLQEISCTNQALDNCTHARQAADDWWLEPSQNGVSWMTVDDHTLQQFMDRWTVLVTIFKTTASTQPVRETNFHLALLDEQIILYRKTSHTQSSKHQAALKDVVKC
ncbi:hypothetical protein MAR_021713, partial [Mya arenaria]